MLPRFLSGHTSGVYIKTKRRSKGCYLCEPGPARTGDTPSPLRHRDPPGEPRRLKGIQARGALEFPPSFPGLRPGTFPPHQSLFPTSRRLGLPLLRRREAAGAGGRDPPRAGRSPGRSRPGRTGPARQVRLRAAKPSPLGSGWAGRDGRPGASPAGSERTGETFLPGGEAPAAAEASTASMGPDTLPLGTYGGAAAAATLLLWAVYVLCRRRRYRGGGRPPHSCTAGPGERGCGRARRRRAAHWAALLSARPSAQGRPISAAGPGAAALRMAALRDGGPPGMAAPSRWPGWRGGRRE